MDYPNAEEHLSTQNVDFPVTLKDLLEAGVHFGHRRRKWNPKMSPYIFAEKQGIHIIDIRKTLELLKKACEKITEVSRAGGKFLFVCTKNQSKDIIEEEAKRCGAFFVNERWLGGTLTNFQTIRSRIEYLEELEEMEKSGQLELLPKMERLRLMRKKEKLYKLLRGLKGMTRLPDMIYIVDIKEEEIALREAQRLKIPVVALVDTDSNPELVDYPIPGNDDAIKSIKLITRTIANAIILGREGQGREVG